MVPGDQRKPAITSGIRLGTPAITTMGMKESDMERVAVFIDTVCRNLGDVEVQKKVANEVRALCLSFPVPGRTA